MIVAVFGGVFWYNVFAQGMAVSSVRAAPIAIAAAPVSASAKTSIPAVSKPKTESVAQEPTGAPVRIKIPRIGVDAWIERVALTSAGSMDVPKHRLTAGWYELGPRPGETGSAIIAGHVDWYYGASAVFANLHQLKPGDTITVENDKGIRAAFIVRESRTYSAASAATDVFVSNDGAAHLNLITCTGNWDKGKNQYTQRLVVFADLVVE